MRHTFELDGIYINPELPEDFDNTPLDERDEDMNLWWDKPYIEIEELSFYTWEEHYYRLKELGYTDEMITKEDYLKGIEDRKKSWAENWSTGFRYNVRCLDGGAWDRSSNHGFFASFDEAMEAAKRLL